MSQPELAQAVGVRANSIVRFEGDFRRPSLELLARISKALEVSADSLIGDLERTEGENGSEMGATVQGPAVGGASDEAPLLVLFRRMGEPHRELLLLIAGAMASHSDGEAKVTKPGRPKKTGAARKRRQQGS